MVRWLLGNIRPAGSYAASLNAIYQGPAMTADPVNGSYMLTDGGDGQYTLKRNQANAQDITLLNYVTVARAGVGATDFDKTGTLTEYAASTLRYGYSAGVPQGWLVEAAVTNSIQNPRAEGAVVGSPGTMPTGWGNPSVLSGTTMSVDAVGTENGMSYVDYRFQGTVTGVESQYSIIPEGTAANIVATSGQTWTASAYMKIVSGDLTGFNFALLYNAEIDNVGNFFATSQVDLKAGLTSTLTRYSVTRTYNNASTTNARLTIYFQGTIGATYNVVIRVAGPQMEQNYYASSLILPPVAAPAAQIRNVDQLTISGSRFIEIFGNGAPSGYAVMEYIVWKQPSIQQMIFCFSDGTSNNRTEFRSTVGGGLLFFQNTIAGVANNSPSGTAMTNLTVLRAGITWDRSEMVFTTNTGTPLRAALVTPPYNEVRIGRSLGNGSNLNGRVRKIQMGNAKLTDAQLQAMCVVGA